MRLFLSYSHKDMEQVKALQESLKAMGHSAVCDEDFMRGDSKWRDQIERIIRSHDAVIYAISPDAVKSAEVRDEIEKANKYRKPILHVKVANFDDTNNPIPRALEQFYIIDATGGVTERVKGILNRDFARIANDFLTRRVFQIVTTLIIMTLTGILSLFVADKMTTLISTLTNPSVTISTSTVTVIPSSTATRRPTWTKMPTSTSRPTSQTDSPPSEKVMGKLLTQTEMRTGPGSQYPVLFTAQVGELYNIEGKVEADGTEWLEVTLEGGSPAWIIASAAIINPPNSLIYVVTPRPPPPPK